VLLQGEPRDAFCDHSKADERLHISDITVSLFCDSLTFVRQSHFSATVWTGLNNEHTVALSSKFPKT